MILAGAYFKIPRYQRPYSWEREQVEEFWEDTIQNADSDYCIGSVVVFKGKGDTAYSIVDGQQRFTTITMVLCALSGATLAVERIADDVDAVRLRLVSESAVFVALTSQYLQI